METDAALRDRLVQSSIALGAIGNPIVPLILESALIAAKRGAPGFDNAEVADIARQVAQTATMADLTEVLCSEAARRYGIDLQVAAAIAKGKIVPTAHGFVEQLLPRELSLADQALKRLTKAFSTNSMKDVVSAVLQLDMSASQEQFRHFITEKVGASGPALLELLSSTEGDTEQAWKVFSLKLLGQARDEVNKVMQPLQYAEKFDELAARVSVDASTPSRWVSDGAMQVRSGALALRSLAILARNNDLAARASEVAGYAQSAVQVTQAVGALLSAGTGWGAAVAIIGLAGGVGGMQLPSMGGDAQTMQMHQAVMQAIANMVTEMRAGFKKINDKLDAMATALETLVSLVRENNAKLTDIQQSIRTIENKVDRLQLGMHRMTYMLVKSEAISTHQIFRGIVELDGAIGFSSDQQMIHALDFYADFGSSASKSPAQIPVEGKDDDERLRTAQEIVDAHILYSSQEDDRWPAVNALTYVLEAKYGCPEFGVTVHEPQLRFSIEYFAGIKRADPERYERLIALPAVEMQRERQLSELMVTIGHHQNVMQLLRTALKNQTLDPQSVLGVLLAQYDALVDAFATRATSAMYRRVWDDRILELTDAAAPSERQDWVNMQIFSVSPDKRGMEIGVLTPAHTLGSGAAVLPLYTVRFRGADGAYLNGPLEVGMHGMHIHSIETSDEGLKKHYIDFDTEIRLLGTSIARFPLRTCLHYGRVRHPAPVAAAFQNEWTRYHQEPFARLAMADDYWYLPSGKAAVPDQVIKMLKDGATINNAKAVLRASAPTAGWFERQIYLGRALAKVDGYNWKLAADGHDWQSAADEHALYKEAVAAMDRTTRIIQAVCRVAYEDDYRRCDVLKSLLEGEPSTRLVDAQVIQLWGATVSRVDGQQPADEARLAASIDTATPTDHTRNRYREPPELARMRASQLRQAVTALVKTGEHTGMSFVFERARRYFEETFR